jgi:hypothetical protein
VYVGFRRLRVGRLEADLGTLGCATSVNLSGLETPLGQRGRYEPTSTPGTSANSAGSGRSDVGFGGPEDDDDHDEGWLDVVVVACLLGANASLTSLDLSACALCGLNGRGQGKRSARAATQLARALASAAAAAAAAAADDDDAADAFVGPAAAGSPLETAPGAALSPRRRRGLVRPLQSGGLRELCLARNLLDGAAAAALAPGLAACTRLQRLDLSRNLLGAAALRVVRDSS